MRMPQKMFKIDTYLRAGEAFHHVRKSPLDVPPLIEHDHDYFELMLIEQGEVHHWINGLEERLQAGHLVFIRPPDSHALQAVPGSGARLLNVMFRQETAEHLEQRYGEDLKGRFFWSRTALPATLKLRGPQFERAVNAMVSLQSTHRSITRIEQFLLSIMTHALDTGEVIVDQAPAWLLNACRAASDPRVFRRGGEGFVEAAGRSQAHVCRQTRKHLGLSPTQYVNRIRIQHAAMLLAGTQKGVHDIAHTCGFENISYFHKLFREQYGATPRGFRLRHLKQSGD